MDTAVRAVIEAIHASPTHAVLGLSGGAAQVSSYSTSFEEFVLVVGISPNT